MGLNNVTSAVCQMTTNAVYLLDPDGSIKSVEIPFHLALRYVVIALLECFSFFVISVSHLFTV